MKALLFPHGGSGNHGCEAIIRSTAKILDGMKLELFSIRPEQDFAVGLDRICSIYNERKNINPISLDYLIAYVKYHFLNNHDAFELLSFSPILSKIGKDDILLSIGGDNYCYGAPSYIYLINKVCREKRIKTVLWGCSIEPNAIDEQMLLDLKGYTRIFARESITYEALTSKGLENISLFPDPAFQLKRKDIPLPEGFEDGNTVGINISPLIIRKEKKEGITLLNFSYLIEHIIMHSNMKVALIPHVVWSDNDDREPLTILYEKFKNTGRVILLEDHPAEEVKSIIGRCRFMVAARTHASIAAYSQQIPTLVIGYSVKARGIAKDIFGTDKHYVLPVQQLQKPDDLTNEFSWLLTNENEIKNHYLKIMPEYINRALEAGTYLKGL